MPANLNMNALTPLSSSSSASSQFYKLCATVLQTTKRHSSSYRRHRIKNNIKPDPAFLPTKTEPHDHIIHNPPPSMPNIYHTPTIFLPKDDPRRALAESLNPPQPRKKGNYSLPPAVRKPYEKKYHLTETDLQEMRKLRAQDPWAWSEKKLSEKFDCSRLFVSMATEGISERAKKAAVQSAVTGVVKSNWGKKRREAREDRELRREKWYKDA